MAITIPVPEDIGPADNVYPPTADQVAIAIIAASKETGASPQLVASRANDNRLDRTFAISRARTYAALAIRAIFPENSGASISRMVGSSYPEQHLQQIDSRMKNNDLKWFDNDAFMRVVDATEESV